MSSTASDYDIEFRWKEEVIYWEGDHGFVFDGGWGVSPMVTYVPAPGIWDEVVPAWLRGRREVVVARLKAHEGHVVVDDPGFRALADRELLRQQDPDR